MQKPDEKNIFKSHIKFIFYRTITLFSFLLFINKKLQVDQFSIDIDNDHADYFTLEFYLYSINEIVKNQFENLQKQFQKCLQQPNKQKQELKTDSVMIDSKQEITDYILGWIFLKSDVLYVNLFLLLTNDEKEIIKQTIELWSKFQVQYKMDGTDLWLFKKKQYQLFEQIKKVQGQERTNFIKNRIKVVYDCILIGLELRRYDDLNQQFRKLILKINQQENYDLQIQQPVQNIAKFYNRIQSPRQIHYFMIKTQRSIDSMNLFERIKKINQNNNRKISIQFILRQLGTDITGKVLNQKINLLGLKKFNNYYLPEDMTPEEKLFQKKYPNSFKNNLSEKDYTQSFTNSTMLIPKHLQQAIVFKNLKALGYFLSGIQYYFEQKFKNRNQVHQNNTYILHHNNSLDDLLDKTIRNENFTKDMNGGKHCFEFIAITKYIQIMQQKPLQKEQQKPKELFYIIKDFLLSQFPNKNFQVWRHNLPQHHSYYIKIQNKYSTLSLYYFLAQWEYNVHFVNPQKFEEVYRNQLLNLIYNSDRK